MSEIAVPDPGDRLADAPRSDLSTVGHYEAVDEDTPEALAGQMFEQMRTEGQSSRRIVDEESAESVRALLRQLGRSAEIRLRTARMDDLVVVARLDAALWNDDATTMRAKLRPPV